MMMMIMRTHATQIDNADAALYVIYCRRSHHALRRPFTECRLWRTASYPRLFGHSVGVSTGNLNFGPRSGDGITLPRTACQHTVSAPNEIKIPKEDVVVVRFRVDNYGYIPMLSGIATSSKEREEHVLTSLKRLSSFYLRYALSYTHYTREMNDQSGQWGSSGVQLFLIGSFVILVILQHHKTRAQPHCPKGCLYKNGVRPVC